jgi:hypothetical protein
MSQSRKRALLIGVDSYEYLPALTGCVNDVLALHKLLSEHANGDGNFDCRAYSGHRDTVSRGTLLKGVDKLLEPGADVALLYFAGHGMPANQDVVLAPQEAMTAHDGVSLSTVLGKVQESPISEIFIILDCCFSGGAGRVPQLGANVAALREGLALLTASRADQAAAETPEGRGLFSSRLCGALQGGAADALGEVTLAGVYAYLAESFGSWEQQLTFKANLLRLSTLRRCEATLSRADLRTIVRLFRTADSVFPLDKSYEFTCAEFIAKHGEILELLQKGRAARIIEPVGTPHLYFACKNETGCRLTPLGEHYWYLGQNRRI